MKFVVILTVFGVLTWSVSSTTNSSKSSMIIELPSSSDDVDSSSSSCESSSKPSDIFSIPTGGKCVLGDEHPIDIVHQNGMSVTFKIFQDWTNHEELQWLAANYEGKGNRQRCLSQEGIQPGESMAFTAECQDGLSVVDLYISHPTAATADRNRMNRIDIPQSCKPPDQLHSCHFRYALKCSPTKCQEKGKRLKAQQLTAQKIADRLARTYGQKSLWNLFSSSGRTIPSGQRV